MSPLKTRSPYVFVALLTLVISWSVWADELELQPDHPERYTVVEGDTLWDIATRFLKSPWHWAKIWKINEQVENPHLIYPGDVLVFRWVDGQPQITKLPQERVPAPDKPVTFPVRPDEPKKPEEKRVVITEPKVVVPRHVLGNRERVTPAIRSSRREQAIPTIPPDAVRPFLLRSIMLSESELDDAGYITIGLDERRALGNGSDFYARGISNPKDEYFFVFRKGRRIVNPDGGRLLGYEAIYLGDAKMLRPGNGRRGVSKLTMLTAEQEILPTDRLLPVKEAPPLPVFQPHAPDQDVRGHIVLTQKGIAEFGALTVVAINLGKRDKMEVGHVLRIWHHAGESRDPVTRLNYERPDEPSGLLMVFRVQDRVSYGLVMKADIPVRLYDRVTTP